MHQSAYLCKQIASQGIKVVRCRANPAPIMGNPSWPLLFIPTAIYAPGMCVVMTSSKAKGILDHLEGSSDKMAEEVREIYVAASRAEKLLVIACPKSQVTRLIKHFESNGAQEAFDQPWT